VAQNVKSSNKGTTTTRSAAHKDRPTNDAHLMKEKVDPVRLRAFFFGVWFVRVYMCVVAQLTNTFVSIFTLVYVQVEYLCKCFLFFSCIVQVRDCVRC